MLLRADPALRSAQADLAQMLFPDGVQAFDLTAALGRLELPAKIIWGRADRIIPWRHALLAPGRVALHLLEGVGHMPHVEAPAMVGALLQELTTLAGGNAAAGH
jgi:pyruvate dehydrogenase E2 component (dihydrolipoamide acetyltransferase)